MPCWHRHTKGLRQSRHAMLVTKHAVLQHQIGWVKELGRVRAHLSGSDSAVGLRLPIFFRPLRLAGVAAGKLYCERGRASTTACGTPLLTVPSASPRACSSCATISAGAASAAILLLVHFG